MIHPEYSINKNIIALSSSDEDIVIEVENEPRYKKKINFFLFNKFSKEGTRFSHCLYTSCHRPPKWAGSWINTWKICTKPESPNSIICSFSDCNRKGVLGAHVMYSGSNEKSASWYIIPACHRCNRKYGQAAHIKHNTVLLKVMKGRILKDNKILIGFIDIQEYNRIKSRLPAEIEFDNTCLIKRKEFLQNDKIIRNWPEKRIGGWGWKK